MARKVFGADQRKEEGQAREFDSEEILKANIACDILKAQGAEQAISSIICLIQDYKQNYAVMELDPQFSDSIIKVLQDLQIRCASQQKYYHNMLKQWQSEIRALENGQTIFDMDMSTVFKPAYRGKNESK